MRFSGLFKCSKEFSSVLWNNSFVGFESKGIKDRESFIIAQRQYVPKYYMYFDSNADVSSAIVSNIPDSGSGQIQPSPYRLLSDKAFDAWVVGANKNDNRTHIFSW